jgi:hypothetical protein
VEEGVALWGADVLLSDVTMKHLDFLLKRAGEETSKRTGKGEKKEKDDQRTLPTLLLFPAAGLKIALLQLIFS